MANSHVSYLHTLAKDEASAFVASLQKVKEHLSYELQWMSEQVQQKTVQLQGIDTLLSEAVGLGLLAPQASSTEPFTTSAVNSSSVKASESQEAPLLPASATLTTANGNNLAAEAAASTAPPQRGKRQQSKPSQSKRDVKLPVVGKTNATKSIPAKGKKPGRPAKLTSDASNATTSGFQRFLQVGFQDKSMTDAVGEILAAAKEPMNTDAIMAKLYDGLSGEPYQRAKSSLSNILSVGKSKGKWKSPGRGTYLGS